MTKLDGKTPDLAAENIEQLRQIFPDVFEEGKIDFDKLKQVLGEYVDDEKERYNFTWNGKGKALRLAQTPTTGTLRPCEAESKNWDDTQNLYIEGDNLEVLKLLQKSYHGKIKMIYIDPPYNTGKDFVYDDDYSDNLGNYLSFTQQIDENKRCYSTNPETNGKYHTRWLNNIYPRLRLARSLLADDGIMCISISDIEISNLRKICGEIFGEDNFVADLIWSNKEGGGSSDSKLFRIKHEHILIFSKVISKVQIKGVPITNEDRYKSSDEFEAIRGKYYLQKLGMGSIQYSDSLDYPINTPDGGVVFPADNNGGKKACWRWSKEKLKWGIENGFVEIKKDSNNIWTVYTKQYLNCDNEGNIITRTQRPMGIIDSYSSTQAAKYLESIGLGNMFDYTKPYNLITYLVNICSDDGIILDFFSGSATTAHAVMQLNAEDGGNRKFIMVQLPEPCADGAEAAKAGYKNICEIGKERIRRAGEKIKAEIEEQNAQLKIGVEPKKVPDIGFKVFKLDSSNLKQWQPDYDDLETTLFDSISNYVEGRSELDVVYEIMLKMGMELTWPLETHTIGGKNVYEIGMGALMICLDDHITTEVAEGMAALYKELAPETWRVVFKDNGFADDSAKVNIKEILKTAGLEEDAFTTV